MLASTVVLGQASKTPPTPDETPPEARRQEVPTDDVGVYSTLDGSKRFVLDRSGGDTKVQFEGSNEVLVLKEEPASLGERLLKLDSGEVLLKITTWGGLTLYTPSEKQGVPVDRAGSAQPISIEDRPISDLQHEVSSLEQSLSGSLGANITVVVDWGALPDSPHVRAALFDTIAQTRAALGDYASDEYGRAALAQKLKSLRFEYAGMASSEFTDGTWIVRFAPDQGLSGRLTSQALRTSLSQTF